MISALTLGIPPTQHRNRQVSELGAERNQPQKEKQTEGCCLNPAVKGSASALTVRHTHEGFLRVEGTSESLPNAPHYPRHRESKQNSDTVKDLLLVKPVVQKGSNLVHGLEVPAVHCAPGCLA